MIIKNIHNEQAEGREATNLLSRKSKIAVTASLVGKLFLELLTGI